MHPQTARPEAHSKCKRSRLTWRARSSEDKRKGGVVTKGREARCREIWLAELRAEKTSLQIGVKKGPVKTNQ